MFKLSIRLCLAITLVVCLSATANAMPNTATYAQNAIVPEEELSQIDAADLSHLTGGPVAATPGYDPKAVFKTLLNPKIPFNQLLSTLEDSGFPGRVLERTLVKLEEANPGLRTNPTKLKEIKLYTQMRITNIVLSLYYAQDIASAKSSVKGESVLVQSIWGDIVGAVTVVAETAALIAVQAVPGVDVLVDVAAGAEATGDIVETATTVGSIASDADIAGTSAGELGGSIASETSDAYASTSSGSVVSDVSDAHDDFSNPSD